MMHQRADSLVGPRRNDDDQGMIGLALARRAMEIVARMEPARISRVRATLAWALFTAGSDEEALAEIRRARAEAPEEERALVDVETLESAVTEARSSEQIRILERTVRILETSLRALEREVERRTTKAMREGTDLRRLESMVKLAGEIEALTEPEFGRLARAERWLDSARGMRERSMEGAAARAAWQSSFESIARDPRFAGLKLEPQLGLVPLGPDPASGLLEFAHVGTGTVPERRADGTLVLDAESALVLVLLPGGVTRLGAQKEYDDDDYFDPDLSFLEDGDHHVRLDPYFVGKHEITLAQWMRIAGTNPNRHQPGRLRGEHFSTFRNPVESVSYNDAEAALRRVGLGLPTEAQIEYAGRAGTTTPWWTGQEPRTLQDAANVCDAAYCDLQPSADCDPWNDGWATHAPVGSYRANDFGLHDTAGNVWDWCRDHATPPDHAPRDGDGLRPSPPGVTDRIFRGGG
jgi:formylglycine-generating enzyme required for sulfatase activity